jgi:hypothetical protein
VQERNLVCESGDRISKRIIIRAIENFCCHMSKIYKRDWITGHICNWSVPELHFTILNYFIFWHNYILFFGSMHAIMNWHLFIKSQLLYLTYYTHNLIMHTTNLRNVSYTWGHEKLTCILLPNAKSYYLLNLYLIPICFSLHPPPLLCADYKNKI